jgi:N-acetylglucosaminyldiphosphoundecaprenol N-acetyl-beta-D-mannosaminyltransferase
MSDTAKVWRRRVPVLDVPVDALSFEESIQRVTEWAAGREKRSVVFCNVHSVMTARRNADLAAAISVADMVAPDGAPIAWYMRKRGNSAQRRISGPDFMIACCGRAAELKIPIFLCGSTDRVLRNLRSRLVAQFPLLQVSGMVSPSFQGLGEGENEQIVDQINQSNAGIVWVALGCPKQELWIWKHRGLINGVVLGVGAAFDFHSGVLWRAPVIAQRLGLEWLFRLCQEPRRLFARYAVTNTAFVFGLLSEVLKRSVHRSGFKAEERV